MFFHLVLFSLKNRLDKFVLQVDRKLPVLIKSDFISELVRGLPSYYHIEIFQRPGQLFLQERSTTWYLHLKLNIYTSNYFCKREVPPNIYIISLKTQKSKSSLI